MKSIFVIGAEAVFVGILLIIFVFISQFILKALGWPMSNMPEVCKGWNSTHIMEATLFLAGFLFHSVFEYAGLNKKYVDNYYL